MLAVPVLALGLWTSWHFTFGVWRADADVFVTVQLWKGVREFGLGFVRTWSYTQDNWLFSLIPLSSLLFEAFGADLRTAVLIGWLIFVASVAMTAWLAWRLAGVRAGLVIACILMFASLPALGQAGYFAYPISHNLSMAWGLLTLILALRALERSAIAPALAAAVAVFINVVSDPWAAVAVAGPLIIASGVIAWRNWNSPVGRTAFVLAAASAVALLLVQTRLFGLLSFLPKSHFAFADLATMRLNIGWAQRSLGTVFNIIPGANLATTPPRLFGATMALLLFGWAMAATTFGLARASVGRQLVGAVAVLSIAGMTALFVLSRFPPTLAVGRFFPNLYFLGSLLVVLLAAEHWRRWPVLLKAGLVAYAVLFAVSGIVSAPGLLNGKRKPAGYEHALDLAAVLSSRGLALGYGPFWGTNSLLMDTLTEGRVTIRPVSFMSGRIDRRPIQTSSLWFTPAAEPKGDPRRFLVILNDGEECPVVETCVQMALRQFGPPSERFPYGEGVILVWPRPIAPQIGK